MTVPFDLTSWYLNARRIAELTGMEVVEANRVSTSDQPQRLADLDALRRSIVGWMKGGGAEPLEKLVIEGRLREGSIFTLNTNFFFKGLSATESAAVSAKSETRLPTGYAKLDHLRPGLVLTFSYHTEHLTSASSWAELRGQKRMFVLGVVTHVANSEITAKPYVIANVVENRGVVFGAKRWSNQLEVHIEQIDEFALVHETRRSASKKALEILKGIPEQAVKEAFAEIIGEASVPKDWGGEQSDLFSSALHVEGERVSAAFALKGPAKFRPMTLAELGKNGDQINRLYEEPADLLILQHCHEVTNPVRRVMRSFAQQMGNPRTYCVIDGFDTLRILRAYGKCGLSASATKSTSA